MREKLPDGVYIGDSRHMDDVDDASVDLVVTSPPYGVDKEYEKGKTFDEWLQLMKDVLAECNRKLKPCSRACINVANISRKPYIPIFKYIIDIAFDLGWTMRGNVIWMKGVGRQTTAWGSYMSASDPVLMDNHEYILMFQKGDFKKEKGDNDIFGEEFIEFANAEWYFSADKASKVGHPAPFPDELPRRCILFYSNKGDTVLDPFGGSGTTLKVANYIGRKGIIYEQNKDYLPIIKKRLLEPLNIDSDAHVLHIAIEAKLPEIANVKTQRLREMCVELGSMKATTMTRTRLVEEYIRLKSMPSLDSYATNYTV